MPRSWGAGNSGVSAGSGIGDIIVRCGASGNGADAPSGCEPLRLCRDRPPRPPLGPMMSCQGRSVALKRQAACEAGRMTALNDRQRHLSHHRRGQLNHVTIQMPRGSAQCDACARAGWWEQPGRAKPLRHMGCDERPWRRRCHQPGQPAAGVAGVQGGGEGVRGEAPHEWADAHPRLY